jgi:hypothetical protein
MMTFFTHQPDVQNRQLRRLEKIIAPVDPSTLCLHWLKLTGSLDLLLWTLCNAGISALYQRNTDRHASGSLPDWLQSAIECVFEQLVLRGPDELRARLKQMPFTKCWNDRACQILPVWSKTGFKTSKLASDHQSWSPPEKSLFERLRMDFDISMTHD